MLLPVVVGVDGSAESLAAAAWAAREAVRRERPLRLVLVRGRRPDRRPSAVRRALHEAEERAARAAPGVVLGSEVVDGPVADRLVRAAGRGELLVLGCRGPHGFTGFPVGPVVLGAVAGAVRPVVLVRAGEPSDDDRRTPPGRRRPGEGGGRRHRAALGASGSVEQASDDDHRTPHGASGKAGEEDDDHRAVPGTSGTAGQESDGDYRAAPGVSGPAEQEAVGGASDTRDVVLGLDLGDPRDDVIAFAFAFEEARVRGARLKVVHAWDPPSLLRSRPGETYVADGPRQAEEWLGLMTAVLQVWRDKFPDVEAVEQVAAGRARTVLVRAASRAGLLVVGRRTGHARIGQGPTGHARTGHAGTGRGPTEHRPTLPRSGPVTHAAVHHAGCPVAVVPHE